MPNSLNLDKLNTVSEVITPLSLTLLQKIGEYKGRQILYSNQQDDYLNNLQIEAIINNTIYSNAIDGINIEVERFYELYEDLSDPANDIESEIVRYIKVLNIINWNYESLEVCPELILDFHKNLFRYKAEKGGKWKPLDNIIEHYDSEGNSQVVFVPVSAEKTPLAIRELCLSYESIISSNVPDLIVIAAFLLDFLCIHPFTVGNGRLVRLLTLYLLNKQDYYVAKFMSLDEIIYKNRDKYLFELNKASKNWHEEKHNLAGWIEFFLWTVYIAYGQLDKKIFEIKNKKGAKSQQIKLLIDQMPSKFKVSDLVERSQGVSRPTINKVLQELRDSNYIKPLSLGRDAVWVKLSSE